MTSGKTLSNSHKPIKLLLICSLERGRLPSNHSWATNRGDTLKITLSQSFIINKLSINVKPALSRSGKVVFKANPDQKPYIVFDDHREAPVGFGVKVSLTKKTYVIQRRVSSGDRSVSEGKKPNSVTLM